MRNVLPSRRDFLRGTAYGSLFAGLYRFGSLRAWAAEPVVSSPFATVHADEEWRQRLTPAQYDVLRQEGTERPFSSPLLDEHREGTFHCVACAHPLFASATKFDSGTGWPSFFDVLPQGIGTKSDRSFLMERTEYHCAQCGGHHGHVFDDGPKPTGLRYCSNGVALKFLPKSV